MSKKTISNLLLLLTAIIWGSAFVAQKAGTVLESFTYNGIRTFIGGLALIPVILVLDRNRRRASESGGEVPKTASGLSYDSPEARRSMWIGGIACGLILTAASNLQQFGMYFDTDAGKAGFITALYIVLVPVLGVVIGKRIRPLIWFCVGLGALGFYFLTMAGKNEGFQLRLGDLLLLLGALAFSCHILVIDHFSPKCDGVKMSFIQFMVAGIVSMILMFIFESPKLSEILDCWLPILYAGVLSSGMGYTLQIIAQKHADPSSASLIMSLESVFAVLTGALILHERMSAFELGGCLIIFIAVILAQLPERNEKGSV